MKPLQMARYALKASKGKEPLAALFDGYLWRLWPSGRVDRFDFGLGVWTNAGDLFSALAGSPQRQPR